MIMKMRSIVRLFSILVVAVGLAECAVVREGEVGVKRTLGKYSDKPFTEGLRMYNPFTSRIVKVSVQTENLEVELNIPSKEGLNIRSEVSILYSVISKEAPLVLREIGIDYERSIILPVFRSAVADVSSQFFAKDMHTGERSTIENAIKERMMVLLEGRGIMIEAVLLKSIQLPASLSRAIEAKLEADQQAQQMEFVLLEEKQEAERKRIQAQGVRDAQLILAEGLNPAILRFKSIEAFLELAKSPNAKIIVSDGDLPMLDIEGEIQAIPSTKKANN
jgi:regulator of protease activity HflC (stomatin/prohibitin superfamily)